MHWMSVKLPDIFQMREHSWPCRFHIKVNELVIDSTITKSCTFYDVCLFFSSLSIVSIFVNVEKIQSALPTSNNLFTGIYRCCSSIYSIFKIHLKYGQDTIKRQFNSTMENNFAGKTACSLSYPGAGVRQKNLFHLN